MYSCETSWEHNLYSSYQNLKNQWPKKDSVSPKALNTVWYGADKSSEDSRVFIRFPKHQQSLNPTWTIAFAKDFLLGTFGHGHWQSTFASFDFAFFWRSLSVQDMHVSLPCWCLAFEDDNILSSSFEIYFQRFCWGHLKGGDGVGKAYKSVYLPHYYYSRNSLTSHTL